jgi:hypothetical protein
MQWNNWKHINIAFGSASLRSLVLSHAMAPKAERSKAAGRRTGR